MMPQLRQFLGRKIIQTSSASATAAAAAAAAEERQLSLSPFEDRVKAEIINT